MYMKYSVSEFRSQLRTALNLAAKGEPVIVTRHDEEFHLTLGPPTAPVPEGPPETPAKKEVADLTEGLPIVPEEPKVVPESQELEYCIHGNVVGYCGKC